MSDAEDPVSLFLAKILELKSKIISCQTSGENGGESKASSDAENQQLGVEEGAKCLANIREALESLEGHLSSLQALAKQQLRDRETALAAIHQSQTKLLKELEEYKGKSLEVINEVIAFAGESKDINGLLTPFLKFLQNGATENADGENNGGQPEASGPLQKALVFASATAKTALTILGAVSALSLVSKQDLQVQLVKLFSQIVNNGAANAASERPPGKAAKETAVGTADVSYGSE